MNHSLKDSPLLRNAGWMLVGQGASVVLQAGYFVLLARLLGAEQYGVFAGAFALVAIAAPYASMGSGTLFMRYVGLDRDQVEVYLGHILLASACVGSLFVLLLHALAPMVLNPGSASLVLLLALSQCLFTQMAGSAAQVFQTYDRMKVTAFLSLLSNLLRFLAVLLLFLLLRRATALQWAVASAIASGVSAAVCGSMLFARIGRPRFHLRRFAGHIPEGLGYALGGSAQSIYNDVDKTLLSHYGMNLANGIYTTAYRVVDIATLPITALDASALPRFFRESRHKEGVMRLAERLGGRAALLGLATSAVLFACSALLPRFVGPSFAPAVLALRWLALLPALRGWHQLTGSAIAGMGYQRFRTAAQFSVAALNLGLNLLLIRRHGWQGAAWATLASDGTLCILHVLIFRVLRVRHGAEAAPSPTPLEAR